MNFLKYQDFISTNRARAQIATTNNNLTVSVSDTRVHCDPRSVLQTVYDSSNDELWVDSWLTQCGINPNPIYNHTSKQRHVKAANQIPITSAKLSFKECLLILDKLVLVQNELKANVESMTSSEWKQKTVEIGVMKDEFTKLLAKFENAETVGILKNSLEKRRKKRLKQKQRKQFKQMKFLEQSEKRLKLHKDIDQWLRGMKEESEKTKMEENMKKDADCVLAEVTKKKSEARKHLSLISALLKLRSVRESMAAQRGENTSLEDRQAFNITTEKLIKIWENSLKVYSTEELGLRIMLEKNAKDDTKAARLAKERKLLEEWQNVLFGPRYVIPINNPTYWALTAAERDLETFVAIRKSWDTFLVQHTNDMGTNIPIGWVLPDANPSESWAQFLQ